MTLTAEEVRRLFDYDPTTGVFTRAIHRGSKFRAGSVAGTLHHRGYRYTTVDEKKYKTSRLAWLWMTGKWPEGEIDHKNRDPADDRFDNLREASRSQNMQNGFWRNNTSGAKGVYWHKQRRKWQAKITVDYLQQHLGLFDTKEEAIAARIKAASQLHSEFARTYEGTTT